MHWLNINQCVTALVRHICSGVFQCNSSEADPAFFFFFWKTGSDLSWNCATVKQAAFRRVNGENTLMLAGVTGGCVLSATPGPYTPCPACVFTEHESVAEGFLPLDVTGGAGMSFVLHSLQTELQKTLGGVGWETWIFLAASRFFFSFLFGLISHRTENTEPWLRETRHQNFI